MQPYGVREYRCVPLDPEGMASFGLTPADIIAGTNPQNTQIAGGQVARPRVADQALQTSLTFKGRLKTPGHSRTSSSKARLVAVCCA